MLYTNHEMFLREQTVLECLSLLDNLVHSGGEWDYAIKTAIENIEDYFGVKHEQPT